MAKYTRGSDGRFTAQVWDGTYRNGKKHYIKIRSDKFSRDPELKVENFKIKKAPCIPAKRFLVLLFF